MESIAAATSSQATPDRCVEGHSAEPNSGSNCLLGAGLSKVSLDAEPSLDRKLPKTLSTPCVLTVIRQ